MLEAFHTITVHGSYPDVEAISIPSRENTYINYNGELGKLYLKLPEDAGPGDYYKVELLRTHQDGESVIGTCIATENDFSYFYEDASFSELNAGGIRIKGEKIEDNPVSDNNNGENNATGSQETNNDSQLVDNGSQEADNGSQEEKISENDTDNVKKNEVYVKDNASTGTEVSINISNSEETKQDQTMSTTQLGKYGSNPILLFFLVGIVGISIVLYRKSNVL